MSGIFSQDAATAVAKQLSGGSIQKKELATAIRHTYRDDMFWDLMVNESKAQSGPFDGGCLIVAKALVEAFKEVAGGTEIVRMVSALNGGQTEHYGARIGKYICDFYGPFDSPEEWIKRFVCEESIHDRTLAFATGFAQKDSIIDDPDASQKVADMVKSHLPDPGPVIKAQSKALHAMAIADEKLNQLRAQGLEFDLMPTSEGLEISSIFVPEPLRGQSLASKFMKRITELADAKSNLLVLEVGTDEAGIGLMDWYERHGFRWADGCMERLPKGKDAAPTAKKQSFP